MGKAGKNTVVRKIGPSKEFKLVYDSDIGELDLYKWKGMSLLGYWRLIKGWGGVISVHTPKNTLNNVFKFVYDNTDAAMVIVLDESRTGYSTYAGVADTPWLYRTIDQGYLVLPTETTHPVDFTRIPYLLALQYGSDGAVDSQTEVALGSENILGTVMYKLPRPNGHSTLALSIDPSTDHRYWSLAKYLNIHLTQDAVTGEWTRTVNSLSPQHVALDVLEWDAMSTNP